MRRTPVALAAGLLVLAAASSAAAPMAAATNQLESTIGFSSNRDNLNQVLEPGATAATRFEAYLTNPDGTNLRRLTTNADWDGFVTISPNGKKIVYDSTRNHPAPGTVIDANGDPCPTFVVNQVVFDPAFVVSDLFLTDRMGDGVTLLRHRASSATWSPDGKSVAFHASASGAGCPIRVFPGSAATDSDIFVAKVEDLLAGEQPRNITNTPDLIDDDADWSPTGRIVYSAHDVDDPGGNVSNTAELYTINPDGSDRVQLTPDDVPEKEEEARAPSWSPNGEKIVYSCRIGGGNNDSEICVIDAHLNADGTPPTPIQLTDNAVADLTATYSPDGQRIVFQRGTPMPGGPQVFTMAPALNPDGTLPTATQVTFFANGDGMNMAPNWGELKVNNGTQP